MEEPIVEEKTNCKGVLNTNKNEGNNTKEANTAAPCFWVHNQNNTSPFYDLTLILGYSLLYAKVKVLGDQDIVHIVRKWEDCKVLCV
jgi:hypothetical protein